MGSIGYKAIKSVFQEFIFIVFILFPIIIIIITCLLCGEVFFIITKNCLNCWSKEAWSELNSNKKINQKQIKSSYR